MYAPIGGGVKPPIHFHCVLHAKRGWVGPDSMYNCVRTKWKAPRLDSKPIVSRVVTCLYRSGGVLISPTEELI